jgi:hypothetical protein
MIQNIGADEWNVAGVLCENRAGRDMRGLSVRTG